MLRKLPTTAQLYQLYRELEASGCPIDWDVLQKLCDPVLVEQLPSPLGAEVVPRTNGIGILVNTTGTKF